jgi:undecaprenyl-diphosphatase
LSFALSLSITDPRQPITELLMDHQLLLQINSLAGRWPVLDQIGIFLAGNIFVALWILLIIAIGVKFKSLRQNVYLALVSALVSRGIVVEVLKRIFNRPRPYEIIANLHQLVADTEHGMSFPSGHTVIYFSLAFAFWRTKYFWPFFVLAIIGSLARVFVGVHYPADIIVGAIIGIITSLSLKPLFKKN